MGKLAHFPSKSGRHQCKGCGVAHSSICRCAQYMSDGDHVRGVSQRETIVIMKFESTSVLNHTQAMRGCRTKKYICRYKSIKALNKQCLLSSHTMDQGLCHVFGIWGTAGAGASQFFSRRTLDNAQTAHTPESVFPFGFRPLYFGSIKKKTKTGPEGCPGPKTSPSWLCWWGRYREKHNGRYQ